MVGWGVYYMGEGGEILWGEKLEEVKGRGVYVFTCSIYVPDCALGGKD